MFDVRFVENPEKVLVNIFQEVNIGKCLNKFLLSSFPETWLKQVEAASLLNFYFFFAFPALSFPVKAIENLVKVSGKKVAKVDLRLRRNKSK